MVQKNLLIFSFPAFSCCKDGNGNFWDIFTLLWNQKFKLYKNVFKRTNRNSGKRKEQVNIVESQHFGKRSVPMWFPSFYRFYSKDGMHSVQKDAKTLMESKLSFWPENQEEIMYSHRFWKVISNSMKESLKKGFLNTVHKLYPSTRMMTKCCICKVDSKHLLKNKWLSWEFNCDSEDKLFRLTKNKLIAKENINQKEINIVW